MKRACNPFIRLSIVWLQLAQFQRRQHHSKQINRQFHPKQHQIKKTRIPYNYIFQMVNSAWYSFSSTCFVFIRRKLLCSFFLFLVICWIRPFYNLHSTSIVVFIVYKKSCAHTNSNNCNYMYTLTLTLLCVCHIDKCWRALTGPGEFTCVLVMLANLSDIRLCTTYFRFPCVNSFFVSFFFFFFCTKLNCFAFIYNRRTACQSEKV